MVKKYVFCFTKDHEGGQLCSDLRGSLFRLMKARKTPIRPGHVESRSPRMSISTKPVQS